MKKFLLIYILLLIHFQEISLFAQDPLKNVSSPTFSDLQKSFDQFTTKPENIKTKGWKWYKRWLNHNETRLNGDGTIPDISIYYNEAIKINKSKKEQNHRKSALTQWTPVGPVYRPDTSVGFERGLGRINCIAFHPSDTNTFWVGVAQGGVWKTTNGGTSWIPLTDELPILRISDIAVNPKNPNEIYISVGDYAYLGVGLKQDGRKRNTHFGLGVYKTTDGGSNWVQTGLNFSLTNFDASLIRRVFINPDSTQQLLAAGIGGIWQSSDAGTTWSQVYQELIWDIEKDPFDFKTIYASTGWLYNLQMGKAGIIKTTDFGKNWTLLNTGIPTVGEVQRIEISISRANSDYIYAIACNLERGMYGIFLSTDGGVNWNIQSNYPNLLDWLNGTETGGQGTYDLVILADPIDSMKVYAGGINLWESEDGGISWDGASYWQNNYGPSIHADQHYLTYNPLNSTFYICNDGGLYRTKKIEMGSWSDAINTPGYNWPTRWEYVSSGLQITSFYRNCLSRNNKGYLMSGAQDNASFYFDTTSWHSVFGGDGMECLIDPDNPLTIYGSSQYGYIERSDDGGLSGSAYIYPPNNTYQERGEWTTPYIFSPGTSDTLLVGYGNLWKVDNQGNFLQQLSDFDMVGALGSPNLISTFTTSEQNPNYIYVCKRVNHPYNLKGEVWKTTDRGQSWVNITNGLPDSLYFTYIAMDDDDPNTAWLTCGGFEQGVKVFKTTDGGASWINISYNLPNLPVNCVVQQNTLANDPVYVGTDLGVYYINNDLSGWQYFGDGFPNVIVTELEIHYATNKIYASTFGRGNWENNLWDFATQISTKKINNFKIVLYPNPTKNEFSIIFDKPIKSGTPILITDVTGKIIYHQVIKGENKEHKVHLSTSVSAGIYFVKVILDNFTLSQKLELYK